jgi:hypothetical protein
MSILSGLITSKARVRILTRLFLAPDQETHPRGLASELNISPSQVNDELKQLDHSRLLVSKKSGRQIRYSVNKQHPLFPELHSMVKKALGMDQIIDSIITRLGNLESAILVGDYAQGIDSGTIELLLVGKIDQTNLFDLVAKCEKHLSRKIAVTTLSIEQYRIRQAGIQEQCHLVIWESE